MDKVGSFVNKGISTRLNLSMTESTAAVAAVMTIFGWPVIGTGGVIAVPVVPVILSWYKNRDKDTTDDDSEEQEETTDTETDADDELSSETFKPYTYTANNKDGNDYSDYLVLKGYDDSYCYIQGDYSKFLLYDKDSGKMRNKGCSATAMAMAISIKNGEAVSPNNMGWTKDGVTWGWTDKNGNTNSMTQIDYPEGANEQEMLSTIADQITAGNAVVVPVDYRDDAGTDHYVTAIGLKSGATKDDLSLSDILVIDPSDGQVKTLDQVEYSNEKRAHDIRLTGNPLHIQA